jgi:hypothetical protein
MTQLDLLWFLHSPTNQIGYITHTKSRFILEVTKSQIELLQFIHYQINKLTYNLYKVRVYPVDNKLCLGSNKMTLSQLESNKK